MYSVHIKIHYVAKIIECGQLYSIETIRDIFDMFFINRDNFKSKQFTYIWYLSWIQCTMYYCTMYNVLLYSVQCTIVQCTVDIMVYNA